MRYYMQGLFRTARKMFERCVEICAAQGYRRIEAANLPMLAGMLVMEMQFAAAEKHAKRTVNLAEQIGHRRAAMVAYETVADLYSRNGATSARPRCPHSRSRHRAVAGRTAIHCFCLILQAQIEVEAGDRQASQTIREANEIARETPSFVLPYGLGLAAMIAHNAEERATTLAEGERVLAAGAVSHNFIFFNRYAIEACLAAKDWEGVDRYAAALEHSHGEGAFTYDGFLRGARACHCRRRPRA